MLNANPQNGDFTYPFPLNWQDTVVDQVRWGVRDREGQLAAGGLSARGESGPENTVFVAFPAISSTAATLGLTWEVAGFPVDVGYVHATSEEVLGCDHNHLLGAEYNGSKTTMHQNTFTLGTRVQF